MATPSELYSEYRSTYKWHEFSSSPGARSSSATQQRNSTEVVVKKPPKPISDDFHFTRKKKHPEIAHRSHEFFDPSLAPAFPTRASHNQYDSSRERSKQRKQPAFREAQRRAQSEGPGIRNPLFRVAPDMPDIRPTVPGSTRSASARRGRRTVTHDTQDGSMQSSYPPPAPSSKWASRQSSSARSSQMKESVSMGQIDTAKDGSTTVVSGGSVSVLGTTTDPSEVATTKSMSASQDIGRTGAGADVRARRRDYKSEYKQRFRPFSQYEYLGDGRFVPSPANGQSSPPSTAAAATAANVSTASTSGLIPASTASTASASKSATSKVQLAMQQKATSLQGEPWYREVVELRRQANDYKCRGWGTDLVPPHMSDLYHKQMELHEAAARRESLSALSLAISSGPAGSSSSRPSEHTPRGASGDRISPSKSASLGRPSRPRTAPPNRASSKSSRSESVHPVSDIGAVKKHDTVDSSTRKQPTSGQRAKSPTKRAATSRPPSASTASSSVAPSPAPAAMASEAPKSTSTAPSNTQQPPKRQRPTTLNTSSTPSQQSSQLQRMQNAGHQQQQHSHRNSRAMSAEEKARSSRIEALKSDSREFPAKPSTHESTGSVKSAASDFARSRPFSRSSSKGGVGATSTTSSRPPSAFENHIDYFREPVVKSPPEPTRVKSPEAVVRSPDPINWTVPLDTGKTFSVTQSIKDGESSRHSPMSDHSSLFDSVSGTAINLGRGAPVPLHGSHQRISSLARSDVRDLQPGLIKDSTLMRPAVAESSNRPLATEAHPNPSVIPELAEENVRDEAQDVTNGEAGNNGEHMNGASSEQLKCLEEPSFEFEASKEVPAKKNEKKPSYRVLEDPFEAAVPIPQNSAKKAPNYRVLEDPMTTAMYDPSTSSEAQSAAAAAGAALPASSCPPASEVLEGAREKFDKFWGSRGPARNSGNDTTNNEP